MNGEVNGPMEEPSDTPVEGPETAHSDIITTSKDCNVEVYKCDTTVAELPESNHISEASDDLENNEAKCLVNGNGNEVDDVVCEEERDPLVELDQKLHVSEISIPSENHNKNSVNVNEQSDLQTSPENGIGLEKVVETSGIDSVENDHQAPESEPMESDGLQSVEESSDESVVSSGLRQDDAVSIHSDSGADGGDDTSQESPTKLKTSELVTVEKEKRPSSQNGDTCGSPSPEVDAAVIVINDSPEKPKLAKPSKPPKVVPEIKPPLRRSSRAIKRKRYDDGATNGDDDSDNDEVSEPHRRRSRPIVINDTKCLVEMATRQMKSNQAGHYKKEPTVVIIDTNSSLSVRMPQTHKHHNKMVNASSGSVSAESLYQSIVARGTTVTPVAAKANAATQSASPQPLILPTLTDDMFVVEVPSFIVPYIYEKPSVKPFREFVDVLGNELAEQRAKEEKEEQEKREKEKKEKIERGELMEDSEVESGQKEQEKEDDKDSDKEADKEKAKTGTEVEQTDDGKKKLKAEKRDSRKRNDDDDDMSWDGEFSADSDDEVGSDEEAKTVVIKDKLEAVTDLKGVTDLTVEKVVTGKSDNYFDCSLGKFFMNIGLNLVQEYVQNDLLKQQNRKLHKETRTGQNTKQTETSIACLRKNLEVSQENNAPYKFPTKKCEHCAFKTESSLVLAHHMETPHMRNNMYKCSYCPYEVRSPHDMLFHMDSQHQVRGRLERPQSYHQCANCTFEDNGKGKLARHQLACAKKFKPDFNLSPPVEWEPPAKIPKQMPRSRTNPTGPYQGTYQRAAGHIGAGAARSSVVNTTIQGSGYRPRARLPLGVPARAPVHGATILRGTTMLRHGGTGVTNNFSIGNNVKNINSNKSSNQPSISITPLPRQPAPPTPVHIHNATKNSCVICEICDGYIKDLEQLRNHMQWIHKVKIHPKMIYNRPPLNCQKCQFRFFTDQGLERHLLGSHGLITSSMQEAAYKGKDAGRCPVCGRIYQWKLLNHVSRDHSLTLKPAHLSYKCTVCTATFGMYKQFENHVYSAHSVVAKRAMDKNRPPATATKQGDTLKPLKINDEITITPQPTATATADDGAVEQDK